MNVTISIKGIIKLRVLLVFFIIILLQPNASGAGQLRSENQLACLLDSFFLVRPPGFFQLSRKEISKNTAAIIFSVENAGNIKTGDNFIVITKSSEIVKGTLNKIINPCPSPMNTDDAVCGELLLGKEIDWSKNSYDDASTASLLAIKGKTLSQDVVGSIKPLSTDAIKTYGPILNKYTKDYNYSYTEAVRILPPHSNVEYDFISLSYFNTIEYKTAGDKAIKYTSFLFRKDINKNILLLHDNKLQMILAVTDVNNDGIYEVLVYTSPDIYEGTYEVRLFNGTKFVGNSRELYSWID